MQIARRGYAGEVRPVLLAYLMVTSRLLQRPMNLNISGVSSAGKDSTADAAIAFDPTKGRQTWVNDAGMFARLREWKPLDGRQLGDWPLEAITEDTIEPRMGSGYRV
jgi:hypothetical protein